jgi:hypothetical protein
MNIRSFAMGYSPIFGDLTLTNRKVLSRQYFKVGRRTRVIRELMDTLLGTAAGGTAALTQARVQHDLNELGGLRVVETQTLINRATVAGDVTNTKAYLSTDSEIATPNDGAARSGDSSHPAWPA